MVSRPLFDICVFEAVKKSRCGGGRTGGASGERQSDGGFGRRQGRRDAKGCGQGASLKQSRVTRYADDMFSENTDRSALAPPLLPRVLHLRCLALHVSAPLTNGAYQQEKQNTNAITWQGSSGVFCCLFFFVGYISVQQWNCRRDRY